MSKTYQLNQAWKSILIGLSIVLIIFISIFISAYSFEKFWIFWGSMLIMFVLSGLLVFGAFSTKIVVSSNGIISFAFGKSTIISWENIASIEINPINYLILAKFKNPPNDFFVLSPFTTKKQLRDLLNDLANYLPEEIFQKELFDFMKKEFVEYE
jgi:hypothetical protein